MLFLFQERLDNIEKIFTIPQTKSIPITWMV